MCTHPSRLSLSETSHSKDSCSCAIYAATLVDGPGWLIADSGTPPPTNVA